MVLCDRRSSVLSLPRFFVVPDHIERDGETGARRVQILGDEAQHAARVLRLTCGQRVVLCDGSGVEYLGVLTQVAPRACLADVISERQGPAEPRMQLHLFAGLSKGDKMDYLVQKCTELGAAAIHPVVTERSVVRLEGDKAIVRSQRWERIAREAAKQSGRARWPSVSPVEPLAEAVRHFPCEQLVVAWEGASSPLRYWLSGQHPASEVSVGAVIGPEGGLSSAEACGLQDQGAFVCSLGARILRTETAGVVLVALIASAFGELDGMTQESDGGWSCG
jgi:16S rRNA (uracil1498-N3)-methyltransferase